jgi:hypothetical protein
MNGKMVRPVKEVSVRVEGRSRGWRGRGGARVVEAHVAGGWVAS